MANWDAQYVLSQLGLPDRHRPKEQAKEEGAGPSGSGKHDKVDLNAAAQSGVDAAKSDSVPGSVTEEEIGNTAESFKVQVVTGSNVAG